MLATKLRSTLTPLVLALAMVTTACNGTSSQGSSSTRSASAPSGTGPTPASTEHPTGTPPAGSRQFSTDVLVFNGSGTASDDTASVQQIVTSRGLTQRTVSSAQMNALTAAELRDFGVIVWPGGLAKTQSDSLTAAARQRIRDAVVNDGVGYVGFCAGAFIAGSYGSWGLELAPLDFPYYYLENLGYTKAMVDVALPDGESRSLIWYGGPELATFGEALGKYPDGTTAVAQEWVGKGLVILSGPHPEAPSGWKSGLSDPDGSDHDYAFALIRAALSRQPLQGF